MLWLAAYLTGFPPVGLHALSLTHGLAPMWSDLYLISTMEQIEHPLLYFVSVNALSGLYLSCVENIWNPNSNVSMPSRAYTSFLHSVGSVEDGIHACQCPLGLIPHFYFWYGSGYGYYRNCVNALSGLYLISTYKDEFNLNKSSSCQCPLGLIPHFYFYLRLYKL